MIRAQACISQFAHMYYARGVVYHYLNSTLLREHNFPLNTHCIYAHIHKIDSQSSHRHLLGHFLFKIWVLYMLCIQLQPLSCEQSFCQIHYTSYQQLKIIKPHICNKFTMQATLSNIVTASNEF